MGDSLEDDFYIEEEFRVVPLTKKRKQEPTTKQHGTEEKSNLSKKQTSGNTKGAKKGKRSSVFLRPTTVGQQVEMFNQMLKAAYKGISTLELEEISSTDENVYGELLENEGIRSLEDVISAALQMLEKKKTKGSEKKKEKEEKGAPKVLILCSSGLRASTVARDIREKCKAKVAKLFSKHIKIEEQLQFLKNHSVDVGVGTPNRVDKLAELGALDLTQVELLLLDCHQDDKKMTIISMDDTRFALSELWKQKLIPLTPSGKLKFLLY